MTMRARGISAPRQLRLEGGDLARAGQQVQSQAAYGVQAGARMETERDAMNEQIKQSNQGGNAKLGSAIGGIAGSFWGPVGSMVGSAAGGLIGSMF